MQRTDANPGNGYSLDTFDGMHFGLAFGELSTYMLDAFEDTSFGGMIP